jgi:hypothetical protein
MTTSQMKRATAQLEWKHSIRTNKNKILQLAEENYQAAGNTMWAFRDFIADAIMSLHPYSYGADPYEMANKLRD